MTFLPALQSKELTSAACHVNGMYFGCYNGHQQFAQNISRVLKYIEIYTTSLVPVLKTASTIMYLNNCSFKNMRHSIWK